MRRSFLPAVVLIASCTPEAIESQRPAPGVLDLEIMSLTAGERSDLHVRGATPGQRVFFGLSTSGVSTPGFLPAGFQDHVQLAAPLLLGTATADVDGMAQISVSPPPAVAGAEVAVQALTRQNASHPLTTHVVGTPGDWESASITTYGTSSIANCLIDPNEIDYPYHVDSTPASSATASPSVALT